MLPAHRRFDFGDVVPEAGIAGENHHRPLRARRLGADAGAETPSRDGRRCACSSASALRRSYMPPIHMPAWPVSTTTMASSGTCLVSSPQMRAGWIGTASDSSSGLYLAYHSPRSAAISSIQALALCRARLVDLARASRASTALASPSTLACKRIIAAERFRLDVDLDRRRADLRHRPEMRGHAAGLGADEADEIGAVDRAVGALARIAADDADRQRMRAGDRVLAVERGRDRDLQRFGERDQFARRRPRRARRRRRR